MPHEFNNVLVVTLDELFPTFYKSLKTLQSEIDRFKERPYGIKKVQSGGNGRQLLISFDSLPKEIQEAIGDPRKHSHILEMFYKTDDAAVKFFTEHKFEDHTYLPLLLQEEYIINASVLKACAALKTAREYERRTKGGSLTGLLGSICTDAKNFNKTLKVKHQVNHTLPESEKRFKETFKLFLNGDAGRYNYEYLISGKVRNTNRQKVTDNVLRMLNDLFATQGHKPTRTEIARQYEAFLGGYLEVINTETGEMYDPKEFQPLSENTIISYLGKWEDKIATYKHRSGDRQTFMQQFKPYHSLDKPAFAGSIISIDDRQPVFHYEGNKRMWFYNGIDLGSEAFTCWVYGKDKEGIIMDFYRQMVRNYTEWGFHLPAELEAEASLNSSYTGTFLRNGAMFQHVRIEANNARGKRIEAYYRQLRYQSEKQREGWLARPFARSESNQKSNVKEQIIPYNQIVDGCLRDIEDWNNSPHSIHTDKTRWEVFCEMQHPQLTTTNWKAILPGLGYMTTTSCNAGIIKLQGKEFLLGDEGIMYSGKPLINLMKQAEGSKLTAYWIDDNKGEVLKAVLFIGDTCICEAIPKPTYNRALIERTPADEANRELMSKYVATIEGYMREKSSQITTLTVIDNRQKTLNRSFVMPGIKRFEVGNDVPRETEILKDVPEDDIDTPLPVQNFVRNLKDRF